MTLQRIRAEASDEDAEKKNDDSEQTKENEILGEVKSVEDGKITIAIGTRKEMGQPGEQPQGGENGEAPEKPEGDDSKADGAEETDSEATEDTSEDKTTDAEKNAETTDGEDETSADNTDKGEEPDGNGDGQGALGWRSTIYVRPDRRRTGNHSYRQHSDYETVHGRRTGSTWWRSSGETGWR